jgi:hypothetical protein
MARYSCRCGAGRLCKPRVNRTSDRKVDIRLHGKRNSNSHGARPVHQKHLRHDEVDPDKLVVNKEFSLSRTSGVLPQSNPRESFSNMLGWSIYPANLHQALLYND